MNEIMVSILIPTYNHEKYIKEALDSVLMQETKYSYEVLVGEDKSTDRTRTVLKQYEVDHPGKITVYYREHNLRNEKYSNIADLRHRAKGKYLVILEGDDFWISKHKLEKQVTFLEEHSDYIAIAHNCIVVGEDSKRIDEDYPCCQDTEYSLTHYLNGIYPGQLATVMCRNFIKYNLFDYSILERHLMPGDKILYFALVTNGKVKCLQENMTAYRHVIKRGSSYSANYQYNFQVDIQWHSELLAFARSQEQGAEFIEALYFGCLVHGLKHHSISLKIFWRYVQNISNKYIAIKLYFTRMLNIHLLHKGHSN